MKFLLKALMRLQKVKFSKITFKGTPFIFNQGEMELGKGVFIRSSFLSNLIGLNHRAIIISRYSDSKVLIGDNVGISGAVIYARKEITIGDNTQIGANVKIFDNDFHPLEVEARNRHETDKIRSKPVHIGKNCFIGCNAIILKGTKLGDGCVVGAGAVVCGEFPNNAMIAGNPAKLIRIIEQGEKESSKTSAS